MLIVISVVFPIKIFSLPMQKTMTITGENSNTPAENLMQPNLMYTSEKLTVMMTARKYNVCLKRNLGEILDDILGTL